MQKFDMMDSASGAGSERSNAVVTKVMELGAIIAKAQGQTVVNS